MGCTWHNWNPPVIRDYFGQREQARSRHVGGVNLLLGDGSVHFIGNAINLATWRGLGTRAGGEVLGDF